MKAEATQQVDPAILRQRIDDALNNFQVKGIAAVQALNQTIDLTHQILDGNAPMSLEDMQQEHIEKAAILGRRFGRLASRKEHDDLRYSVIHHAALLPGLGNEAPQEVSRAAILLVADSSLPGRTLREEARRITTVRQKENRVGKLKKYLDAATREILPGQILKAADKRFQEDRASLDNVLDTTQRNQQLSGKVDVIFSSFPDDKEHRFLKSQTLAFEHAYVAAILSPKKRNEQTDKAIRALQNIAVVYMNNGHTVMVNTAYETILRDYLGIKKLTEKHLLISNPEEKDGILTDLFFKIEQRQRRAGIQERLPRISSGPVPTAQIA